jgi:hypothetical protein
MRVVNDWQKMKEKRLSSKDDPATTGSRPN